MKKLIFRSLLVFLFLGTGFLAYHIFFGKLLVYAPLTPGFSRTELPHIVICTENGAVFTDTSIDTLVPGVEAFHNMQFRHKPIIFIFKGEKSFLRHSLSRARFCAYYNGNIIYSPRAQRNNEQGIISQEIYLKHELSHAVLFQNAGLAGAMHLPKWLLEGIAMYSADQMGTSIYPSKQETYDLIRQGHFMPPEKYRTRQDKLFRPDIENSIAFCYSEFGCIVEHVIAKYGRDKFIQYLKDLVHNPDHDEVFHSIYETSFDDFISDFKHAVSRD